MALSDVLLIFAQAAMVTAGFGGVVVTLRDHSEHWDEWNRIEFRSILEISGIIIFFSMLPLVLTTIVEPVVIWRMSILLFAVVHGGVIVVYRISVDSGSIPPVFNRIHLIAGILIFSQFLAGIFARIEMIQIAYCAGLAWLLGIGGWLFYLLAIGAHEAIPEDDET